MPQDYKKYERKEQDNRYKILPSERPEVIALYNEMKSLRKVAKELGVNKTTIQIIVNPATQERMKKYSKNRWRIYYDKAKHKNYMKKYRKKKRKMGLAFEKGNSDSNI